MNVFSKASVLLQWGTGGLCCVFGLLLLFAPITPLYFDMWKLAGYLALLALIRLILVFLSGPVPGENKAGRIVAAVLEILLGLLIIVNDLLYVEYFFAFLAVVLAGMAILRLIQGRRMQKTHASGWSSHIILASVLLGLTAGLFVSEFYKMGLWSELLGIGLLLYGVFLIGMTFLNQRLSSVFTQGGGPIFSKRG